MDADELRAVAEKTRTLRAPIQTTAVTIRTRVWTGGHFGIGASTDTDIALAQHYAVRQVTASEVSSSGGQYLSEDLKVGPITPSFVAEGGGGYTQAQLDPRLAPGWTGDGQEVLYLLSGAFAGTYRLVSANWTKPFRYTLVLRRVE